MVQHSYILLVSGWDTLPATAATPSPICCLYREEEFHFNLSPAVLLGDEPRGTREGMPGLQAAGSGCGQWKLQFLFQTVPPPAELPEPQRGFMSLVSSSLIRKHTLILHLQRKPLPGVNLFIKAQLYLPKQHPYFSKTVFSHKKDSVTNPSPNQMCIQGLSMAGASFPSPGAPGDFHPAERQPQGSLSVLTC